MSNVTKSWTRCDICGDEVDTELLKDWRYISYDLEGNVWPDIDVCRECVKSPTRSDTARKIGEIIMRSIGGK